MVVLLILSIVLFLAYANGANDNFKGVATLYGSGAASYRNALAWATFTTALGSLTALVISQGLLGAFSGKGLVPEAVTSMKSFSVAVVFASAITVMLATRFGFPISTTHALTGGLVGAGLIASPVGVNWDKLGSTFFMPLLLSPLAALALSAAIYPLLRFVRVRSGVTKETCVCVGTKVIGVVPAGTSKECAVAMYSTEIATLQIGTKATCVDRYNGTLAGVSAPDALDKLHYVSAGIVCFARALNDTPKIAAILLVGAVMPPYLAIGLVALAMGVGGLINAKKVAETMSHKVTAMNHGQGFTANLVTGFLVIFASKWGLPVSTTHVSCGTLFGIGTVTKQAQWKTITGILLSWVTTLPVAAGLAALSFLVFKQIF